ncbi:hypothetical protein [Rhodoferax saidenbachensis]|uniref:Antitoxin Xre/MbcA/ParS-like toxin-binding domain-containing protein n=1 Tax=Rhodoferax saidenbachensis TaxID=1484693 RepID=A0A1P8KDW7_9BURK|nr:hypothetical protein [Rhodoferax saidenbachensis]APW44223.1 hypothetical protein RS694_17935 [Rhodoferax saidenbachensis]
MRQASVFPHACPQGAAQRIRPSVTQPVDALRDEDFLHLLSAYRATAGLVRGGDMAAKPTATDYLQLARNIATRRVVSFVWREEIWLPFFQFEAGSQSVRPDVQILIDELSAALDGWDLAKWFVEPNTLLNGNPPLALIAGDFGCVHGAARALRFFCCV